MTDLETLKDRLLTHATSALTQGHDVDRASTAIHAYLALCTEQRCQRFGSAPAGIDSSAAVELRFEVNAMVRGLVRCAEFKEEEERGKIWDDECRRALAKARELGWGKGQIGALGP